MRLFLTKHSLDDYTHRHILEAHAHLLQATAKNAAQDAVHYYLCWRSLDWWRKSIDDAEKSGNQYVRLADLLTNIEKENA